MVVSVPIETFCVVDKFLIVNMLPANAIAVSGNVKSKVPELYSTTIL